MSLLVQPNMTVAQHCRNLFADFPEIPNASYFFSNFLMEDGSTLWCRSNRSAQEFPIYHFVKILNPQSPENREFWIVDKSQLNSAERRSFFLIETIIFNREREIELHEMPMQRAEQTRSWTVLQQQYADTQQEQADIRQQQTDIRQQHADIRQQHATLERLIGDLERQNASFERQNDQMRALNSIQDTMIGQLNAEVHISRSGTSGTQQGLLHTMEQSRATHLASPGQHIATCTPDSSAANTILGFVPSTNQTTPSSLTVRSSSTPDTGSPSLSPRVEQASVLRNQPIALQGLPLSSLSLNNPSNFSDSRDLLAIQPYRQQESLQESGTTPSISGTSPCHPASNSVSDGNAGTSQESNESSSWEKVQERIHFLFAQIFSSIKQGWEYFISLF